MFRALIRTFFRGVLVLVVVAGAILLYQLYRSGNLATVKRAVEDTTVVGSVKAAYALHRDLSHRSIGVEASSGRVVLSGKVRSEAERSQAESLARSVDGVEEVENALEIDPGLEPPSGELRSLGERIDDVALLAKIRTALRLDRETKALDLEVHVTEGAVRIRGRVPSEALVERVRDRVGTVSGVETIDVELEVEREGEPSVSGKLPELQGLQELLGLERFLEIA
jgi:osmotically-inducible protein OsmY